MTKPTKWPMRPAKTQISLGIFPVWSEPSLCAQWVAQDPSFIQADNEDSDQTGQMPRLIWVFAGRICILLVLSRCGSIYYMDDNNQFCSHLFKVQRHLWYVHDLSRLVRKPTNWHERQAKTQISLGICPVWSESLLSAWRKLMSLATHWAYSEDSDQTGRMPRLIWDFAGRTVILLVLSWGGSFSLFLGSFSFCDFLSDTV